MSNSMRGKIVLSLIALLFSTQAVFGLSVKALSDKQLSETAEVIVVGKVLSAYSDQDPTTHRIYTYTTIRVYEYLKGKDRPRNLVLKTIGGVKGNLGSMVEGAADFYRDEEVMLFLERRTDGSLFPVGFFLGKFSLYNDQDTGRKVLIRRSDGRGQYFSEPRETTVKDLKNEEKLFFEDFRNEVQRFLQK